MSVFWGEVHLASGQGLRTDAEVRAQEIALAQYDLRVINQKLNFALAQGPSQPGSEASAPDLRALHRQTFYEKAKKEFQVAKLQGRAISKDDIDYGYVRTLLEHEVDTHRAPNETSEQRHNRVLEAYRNFSRDLVFEDAAARDVYIATVAEHMAKAYNYTNQNGEGLVYGVDGGPNRYNPMTAWGRADIDKGMVDCTQFVSMVLFAAGVTDVRFTEADMRENAKHVTEIYFGQRKPRLTNNALATNELNDRGGSYTYDMDQSKIAEESLRRGATYTRANRTIFRETAGPMVGGVGIKRDAKGNSTHGYVILKINSDKTLQIAESAGGTGVQTVRTYSPGEREEYYRVRPNFNSEKIK